MRNYGELILEEVVQSMMRRSRTYDNMSITGKRWGWSAAYIDSLKASYAKYTLSHFIRLRAWQHARKNVNTYFCRATLVISWWNLFKPVLFNTFSMILMMIRKTVTRFTVGTKLGGITNVMTHSSLNNFEGLNARFQQNTKKCFWTKKVREICDAWK